MENNYERITLDVLKEIQKEQGEQWFVKKPIAIQAYQMDYDFEVKTIEGVMRGHKGDYLVIGVDNELYPCRQDIFEKTYEMPTNNMEG